ncbi:putative transcriptional regulator [[Clostridium] aminophilum]|uniref:Putative transcriptional regulator n=1 Tax=[Clostridium] aminophilum TaxID=1526 RepID=A0A1I0DUQ4_9FIRM|nr:putative transcriptional regulator [[Clostridium] aminophilum]
MRNRIEELRKEKGLTQQALGEALGVSRQTIISLESGRYNPSLMLAHALAVLFQTSIEEIFMFDEEEKS